MYSSGIFSLLQNSPVIMGSWVKCVSRTLCVLLICERKNHVYFVMYTNP